LPPFGLFVSEVMIFAAGFRAGLGWVSAVGLALLVVAFAGLLRALHRMLYGAGPDLVESARWRPATGFAVMLLLLLATGLAWPPGLAAALEGIASLVAP
ncbi:MAG TPA: hydrogenase 4 subunit F, partial [Methylomirabilota bacterium]|nr:hydrogenase 4 subunit F [Methylomirabilota bacterium]